MILIHTIITYFADNGISRLNIPKDWQIVELHMDSASPAAKGGHVIVKAGFTPDKYDNALANFIGGILPGRANLIVGRNDLANPNRAAAKGYGYRLIEVGFITNSNDVSVFNNRMDDIARGILGAFGIKGGTAPAPNKPTQVPQSKPQHKPTQAQQVQFTYKAYTAKNKWLPEVVDLNDFAGMIGEPICNIAIKVNIGKVKYRAHVLGGGWLPWVTGYNTNDHNNGYAGDGRPIDAIQVYYDTPQDYAEKHGYVKAQYRVSPVRGNYWSWQYDTETGNGQDGYAGTLGMKMDKFQLF